MKYNLFLKSILAGIFIGLAGFIFLNISNYLVASFLFSLGLLAILVFNIPLFTGKAGLYFYDKTLTLKKMLIIILGNFIGTFMVSTVYLTKITDISSSKLISIFYNISNYSFPALCLYSILCGCFMFIAVYSYKKQTNFIGVLITVLCVMGFILSGSTHSVATMFYASSLLCSGLISFYSYLILFLKIVLILINNFLGSQIISFLKNN